MASEAPSWADQWGAGGIGAMVEDDNSTATKKESGNGKKTNAKSGFNKARTAAVKWVKNLFQKKNSSTSK